MNKVIWIVGQMCTGKTTFAHKLGKLLGTTPFHLDHIDQTVPLTEAYHKAIQTGLIEGFTPHRNEYHYQAIMEVLKGYDIIYIQIAPPYEVWKKNCIPIINNPTDENPPDYSKEEYEQENERIKNLTNPIICKSQTKN